MKKNHGITLIALVVTIVVLLILAGITITYVLGDNSIFKQALDAKTKTEIGKLRERIDVIQGGWYIDKKLDPTVTLDDFWERLIDDNIITSKEDIEGPEKEGENDVYLLDTTEGYIVEVIITPDENIIIGEIIKGKNFPPKVTSIEVLNKTSNSIEVKVEVARLEDGKLSYYYKKESETEYHELKDKIEVTDLTATFTGLEPNQIYNIKVVAENKRGKGEKIVNVLTGELNRTLTINFRDWQTWNLLYDEGVEVEIYKDEGCNELFKVVSQKDGVCKLYGSDVPLEGEYYLKVVKAPIGYQRPLRNRKMNVLGVQDEEWDLVFLTGATLRRGR